jgi:GTPase involved in cell partitioning and DNA repair
VAGQAAPPYDRAREALLNVLPSSVAVDVMTGSDEAADLVVAGQALEVKWAGEGNLGNVNFTTYAVAQFQNGGVLEPVGAVDLSLD